MSRQLVDLEPLSERELRDIAAAAFYAGVTAEHFEGVLFTRELQARLFLTLAMVVSEAGYQGRVASCCASVSPEAASMTIVGLAAAGTAPAMNAASAAKAVARVKIGRNSAPRAAAKCKRPAFLRLRAALEKSRSAEAAN